MARVIFLPLDLCVSTLQANHNSKHNCVVKKSIENSSIWAARGIEQKTPWIVRIPHPGTAKNPTHLLLRV